VHVACHSVAREHPVDFVKVDEARELYDMRDKNEYINGVLDRSGGAPAGPCAHRSPSPILYGICHSKEGSVGGRVLHNGRAIVLQ